MKELEVWREITIPKGRTAEMIIADLEAMREGKKNHIDERAIAAIRGGFAVCDKDRVYSLVRCTPRDFGITEARPTAQKIYHSAKESGLELFPLEVGAQLRLDFQDQEEGDSLWIAMRQFNWENAGRQIPCVMQLMGMSKGREGGKSLWLYASAFRPHSERDCDDRFLFVKPSSTPQ